MCHPSLTEGMCCICYGTVTPENVHPEYRDLHRGKCAILAGVYPDPWCEITCEVFIQRMHAHPTKYGPEWNKISQEYYRYIASVTDEDYDPEFHPLNTPVA